MEITNKHLDLWESAMKAGLIGGRPFSHHTVGQYLSYARKFQEKYGYLTFENLRDSQLEIPPEQFGKRDKFYKAMNCFVRFLVEEGVLDENILQKFKKLRPKRHLPPKRHFVDESGIIRLLSASDSLSEKLIVKLLFGTGLRASEACGLNLSDINLQEKTIQIRRAKWGKVRTVGVPPDVKGVIEEFLEMRIGAEPNEPLLLNKNGKRMDRHGLNYRLKEIGKRAGIPVHPHALRRSFVTINVKKERQLVYLQIACGHSSITTTRSYCQTSEMEVVEAMKTWA